MNGINMFSSHRPTQATAQQTGNDWVEYVIKIEGLNDSELFSGVYPCPETFNGDPNPHVCNQSTVVKEEYQLNDKYDTVEISTNGLSTGENQENAYFLNDQKIGTNRSTNPLQITNNTTNNVDIQSSAKQTRQMEESTRKIIDAAKQPNENEQPEEQKRKRKCTTIPKTQNKKQKTAIHSAEAKRYKCALCHYSASNKEQLKRHISTHSGGKQFECNSFRCSICCRAFSREKAWKSHEKKCKRGWRLYECYICKEMAHNKNHLLKHMRSHTGKMNHCPKCKKQFISKDGLTNHMKSHAELFAFNCKNCHQVFARRSKWESHENRCKLKQYKCEICHRILVNIAHLKYHTKTHYLNL